MDDDPGAGASDRTPDGTTSAATERDGAADSGVGTPDVSDARAPGASDSGATDPFDEPIEPESVNPEHAAFVLLGMALTLVVVVSVL